LNKKLIYLNDLSDKYIYHLLNFSRKKFSGYKPGSVPVYGSIQARNAE